MKCKILLPLLIFILSLVSVTAQLSRQPLIANTFFFEESETSSTEFVNVGSDTFNITRETPISFIRASFQGTKLTGTDALDEFFWRILLDDIELVNATQSLELQETAAIELQAGIRDLLIGEHNITFQHRVSTLTLRTSDISFSLLTNQFLNSSSIPLENQSISFTVDDIEIFTKFGELNFTKLRDDSDIFLSIFGQISSVDSNVDVEIKLRMNGEESGVLSTGIQDPTEIKFVTYSWFFKNANAGLNTIEVFARNLQNVKVTSFDGTIAIAETIGDGIEINFNETTLGTFITSSTSPVLVDSFIINVSNGSTLVIISETTVSKSTAGKDNITMFIGISDFGNSFNHTVQLEGAADIANFPFIAVPPAISSISGLKTISLFAFVESTTATFTNTSFFAIEILPIEILAIVDNAPIVNLINPPDNNVTNSTSITFEVNVTDDFLVVNASLFHNASGTFQFNQSQNVNSTDATLFFNVTFLTNQTILWNVQATDNISQTAFAASDFILIINQTFPPDTDPPIITLIAPSNNTINNTVPLNITFSVIDNLPNNIICTLSNSTTTFDSGTFIQAATSGLLLAKGEVALNQEFPNIELTCFDNTELNNSATLNLNYTLDNIAPVIFPISPPDTTNFNKDIISQIIIKTNCTDTPVFRLNITIENSSDRIASFESLSVINNFIVIDEVLDITDIGIGTYQMNHTCADPHTSKIISDFNVRKNISDKAIRYITDNGNEFKIRYLQNSLNLNTFGSSKVETNDRYKFWFHSNESETKTKRTFIFEIIGKKEVHYISDSKYKAHFIIGDNWIDFEFDDNDAIYIITKNSNGNYEIEITTSKTKLDFLSIGDLNIATVTTEFTISFTKQIRDDTFSLIACPLENLQRTILFIFLILLSFGVMIIGFNWRNGLIGTFGAFMLLILSAFMYACIIAIGILLTGLSIVFISFFVIKGTRNFV